MARSVPNPLEAGEAALGRWSPFLAAAVAAGARRLGRTDTPLVRIEGAGWFARHLGDATFSATPTLDDGAPAEAGSLGYVQDVAPVDAVLAAEGRTVWARLLGQITNLHRLIDLVDGALVRIPSPPDDTATPTSRGRSGVADTSRGRLAHAVQIEDCRVTFWRTVAPTEWSFHPRGVVPSALVGLEVPAAEALVPFWWPHSTPAWPAASRGRHLAVDDEHRFVRRFSPLGRCRPVDLGVLKR